MKKKKLKPYMSPQCTIISLDNVPMLMSGSGHKPGANIVQINGETELLTHQTLIQTPTLPMKIGTG